MEGIIDDDTVAAPPVVGPIERDLRVMADRYVTSGEVGRGGMGVVYQAFDPALGREVALKCVRAAALDEDADRRLAREARAMAQLNHPNVVSIYDVVTDGTSIVLAMEFVRGRDLAEWLNEGEHGPREIIEKFIAAGRGLAAAHECGLVHRDFKSSNVLVADDGRVLVTDFGLARFLADTQESLEPSSELGSDTDSGGDLTQTGITMGTPVYMAPEQHLGKVLDPRTDIYSFCACLWRGLTGKLPFGRDVSLDEMLQRKKAGPPAWPGSVRVSRRIAAAVERGLQPDPEQRWQSMSALLAALEGHPGRRVGPLVAAAVITVATGGMMWLEDRQQICAGASAELAAVYDAATSTELRDAMFAGVPAYAEQTWPRVDAALREYTSAWEAEHRQACEATRVTGEQSEQVMDLRIGCLRRARTKLGVTISLLESGDPETLERAFDLLEGLDPVSACGDVQRLREEAPPYSNPDMARAVAAGREELDAIETRETAGLYTQALTEVHDLANRTKDVGYAPFQAEVEFTTASLLKSVGRHEDAVPPLQRSAELALGARAHTLAGDAANELAFVEGYHLQNFDVADAWLRVGMGLVSNRPGDRDLEGALYGTRAAIHVAAGRYEDAELDYRRAIAIRTETAGPRSPDVAALRDNLGLVLRTLGRYEEAAAERREAWETLQEALGETHPAALTAGINVAAGLQGSGRPDDASKLYDRLVPALERALGRRHPKVIMSRFNMGLVEGKAGDVDRGIELLEQALQDYVSLPDARPAAIVQMRQNIGDLYLETDRFAQGLELMKKTEADASAHLEPNDVQLGWVRGTLGALASRADELELAARSLQSAIDHGTLPPRARAEFTFELAKVRSKQGRTGEAKQLGRQALKLFGEAEGIDAAELKASEDEVRGWFEGELG